MKYLVPKPFPDELLGSVWIRLKRRAGLPIRLVTQALTGRRFSPPLLGVAHVAELAEALQTTPLSLLMGHSMLPYATAFFSSEARQRVLEVAARCGATPAGLGATIQNASEGLVYYQYCIDCAQEDIQRWGQAYWHREHHLPGVRFCPTHLAPLSASLFQLRRPLPFPSVLPAELPQKRRRGAVPRALDIEMCERSIRLLRIPQEPPGPRDGRYCRRLLVEAGLLDASSDIDESALLRWAVEVLSISSSKPASGVSPPELRWLRLMSRPGSTTPHPPLKHLLFESLVACRRACDAGVLTHRHQGARGPRSDVGRDDRICSARLHELIDAHEKEGGFLRLQDALRDIGCWERFRHHRHRYPLLQAASQRLYTSSACGRRRPQTSKVEVPVLRKSGVLTP